MTGFAATYLEAWKRTNPEEFARTPPEEREQLAKSAAEAVEQRCSGIEDPMLRLMAESDYRMEALMEAFEEPEVTPRQQAEMREDQLTQEGIMYAKLPTTGTPKRRTRKKG